MIINPRTWWASKSRNKRENWMLVALAGCIIASGFVESGVWWPVLIGIAPGCVIFWLELTE